MKIELELPLTDFEEIHRAACVGRSRNCIVPRETLAALIRDHSRALAGLFDMKVNLTEPGYESSDPVREARRERKGDV